MDSQDHSEVVRSFAGLAEPSTDPARLRRALENADWSAFVPSRDLVPLRELLTAVEQGHGVTEVHRFATARLRALGARPQHPYHHRDEVTACALSPCGRYLATGNWGAMEELGGLQIWEVAAGRCVNALPSIEGGLGWPDRERTIQWSADNSRIGMSFCTNTVGAWDPFGVGSEPVADADVTNGGGRPPAFALAPDGLRAYISVGNGDDEGVPGCVVPLRQGSVYHDGEYGEGPEPEWMAESLPPEVMADREYGPEPPRWVAWSSDGTRIYGQDRNGEAFSIDAATRQLTWVAPAGDCLRIGTVGMPAAWSADGLFLAHHHGELVIRDGMTGQPVATFPEHPGASTLHWGQRGPVARLAVTIRDGNDAGAEPGVIVYDGGEHRYRLDVALQPEQGDHVDASAWCWAPDGDGAAALTTADTVEVYSLTDTPQHLRTLDVPQGTQGLLWGAGDVLIALGATTLRFVAVETGEVLAEFTFPSSDPDPDEDEEDTLPDVDGPESWLDVEDDRLVDLVEDRDDAQALDATLAWTVDRRFAWPLRWT